MSGLDLFGSVQVQAGSCEHGAEPAISVTYEECFDEQPVLASEEGICCLLAVRNFLPETIT